MSDNTKDLKGAKNIGAAIGRHLNEIGIYSLHELALMSPAKAYRKICERYPGKIFSVCYYLFSLQGALMNVHWDKLPMRLKKELLEKVKT